MLVGRSDVLERKYEAKFRAFAAQFGEFVEYVRDMAGRDLGIQLTQPRLTSGELVSPALVWFQMKGIHAETLPLDAYDGLDAVTYPLRVEHLRFWYISPQPTFLALYVESADVFLILNLQKYVAEQFGDGILSDARGTITVRVPKTSLLDAQAFSLILRDQNVETWKRHLGDTAKVFFRDIGFIKRLGANVERPVSYEMSILKYMSKTRTEVTFLQKEADGSSDEVHTHWEYLMGDNLEAVFPYLSFSLLEEDNNDWWNDDDSEWGSIVLPNGQEAKSDGGYEMTTYTVAVELNDLGKRWLHTLAIMEKAGFVEVDPNRKTGVSVAPFHSRSV